MENAQSLYQPIVALCLLYAGDYMFCAVVNDGAYGYKVYLNGRYTCNIEVAANTTWVLSGGSVLPAEIIEEIGAHIEGFLE